MTTAAQSAWIAWNIQKSECHRTGALFPAASKQITEQEADAHMRAWRERRGK